MKNSNKAVSSLKKHKHIIEHNGVPFLITAQKHNRQKFEHNKLKPDFNVHSITWMVISYISDCISVNNIYCKAGEMCKVRFAQI